jgi:mannitol/fructose-specific phosphotransferase system IIA component (Ntr-type)
VLDAASDFGYPVVDLPPNVVSSPDAVVKFLVGQFVEAGHLHSNVADRVICQVLHRESLGSTAVGHGFALPHSKSDVVEEVLGVVGRSSVPVTWPGPVDADPVLVICLLVTPASKPGESFRALEVVARQMNGK